MYNIYWNDIKWKSYVHTEVLMVCKQYCKKTLNDDSIEYQKEDDKY